jgi:hypothetical protein
VSSVRQHQLAVFFALAFVTFWAIEAPAVIFSWGTFDPRASALPHALIHPSVWKVKSRKSAYLRSNSYERHTG